MQVAPTEFKVQLQSMCDCVIASLGGGLSEYVYRNALAVEMQQRGHTAECERVIPIFYTGKYVGFCRADLMIATQDNVFVIELKSKQTLTAIDRHQGLIYKRHMNYMNGGPQVTVFLVNFGLHGDVHLEVCE